MALILLAASPLGAAAQAGTASLDVGDGAGSPGDSGISVPVSLGSSGGAQVASLQFDLQFDSSRLSVSNVTIGSAAQAAGKLVSRSSPSSGVLRVVVAGLNQDVIADGPVANVIFSVLGGAAAGSSPLTPQNAVASDPGGVGIPFSSLNGGSFNVFGPPPTSIPSATNTTLPSATYTATRTPTQTSTSTPTSGPSSTPSRTPTASRTPTPGPSPTPVTPATSTRTPTRTATVISSPTSASTSPTPPTAGATAPAATSTAAASPSGSPTGPAGTPTFPPEIETAAAATGTALAELEEAVAATATALAGPTGGPPGNGGPSTPGPLAILAALLAAAAFVVGICLLGWSWLRARRNRIAPPAGPAP